MKTGNKAFCSKHSIAFDTGEGCTWCPPKLTIQPSNLDSLTIKDPGAAIGSGVNPVPTNYVKYTPKSLSVIGDKDFNSKGVIFADLSNFPNAVELDTTVGTIFVVGDVFIDGDFKSINKKTNLVVTGQLEVAGDFVGFADVTAHSIKVSNKILSFGAIKAYSDITAGEIKAEYFIVSGGVIKSFGFIDASYGAIEARYSIESASYIRSGVGIIAGLNITAAGTISAVDRILAGTCCWKCPNQYENTTTCSKLLSGQVDAHLVETAP